MDGILNSMDMDLGVAGLWQEGGSGKVLLNSTGLSDPIRKVLQGTVEGVFPVAALK